MPDKIKSQPETLVRHLLTLLVWATVASCLGLVINQFRDKPLPYVYQSKEQRLAQAVSKLASPAPSETLPTNGGIITLEEFRLFVVDKKGLILDARPEIFHRLGHIPGALSLPRDDFESSYPKLRSILGVNKDRPLVVYCSSSSCEDSDLVQQALIHLGYTHVFRFKGGWDEWTEAKMPTEASSKTATP